MSAIKLNTGLLMPLVGKGLWKVPRADAADTVYNAIKTGYRLFDGAGDYGNEKECGDGVARAIKDGLVKREELFITSKLWNTFHAKEHVPQLVKKQLADWQLEYFDLFLIHFPVSIAYVDPAVRYPPEWFVDGVSKVQLQNTPYQETWQAMEAIQEAGYAKSIGVSNVQGALLLDILKYAKKAPSVLQIEHHPYLTQQPLVDLCKELGIAITAYSSFGPTSFVELGMDKNTPSLLKHDVTAEISKATGKTPAQVLLRWATQRGIAVIPKSNDPNRLAQNLNSTDFELSTEQLKAISDLNIGLRFNNPVGVSPLLSIFA
ncbi:Aldo/keto reductase [Mrakia frigida]|uniref:Aldo/keto reductase n=1 Tax=Mrakia frigida TaxID=29902 RepID=UPI003FCC017E